MSESKKFMPSKQPSKPRTAEQLVTQMNKLGPALTGVQQLIEEQNSDANIGISKLARILKAELLNLQKDELSKKLKQEKDDKTSENTLTEALKEFYNHLSSLIDVLPKNTQDASEKALIQVIGQLQSSVGDALFAPKVTNMNNDVIALAKKMADKDTVNKLSTGKMSADEIKQLANTLQEDIQALQKLHEDSDVEFNFRSLLELNSSVQGIQKAVSSAQKQKGAPQEALNQLEQAVEDIVSFKSTMDKIRNESKSQKPR